MLQFFIIATLVANLGMMVYASIKITKMLNSQKKVMDRVKSILLDNFGEIRDTLSAIKIDLATIAGKVVVVNDKIDKFTDQQNAIKDFVERYLKGLRTDIAELNCKTDKFNKKNKNLFEGISAEFSNLQSVIKSVREEFAPTAEEARVFFNYQNTRFHEMVEEEKRMRDVRFAKYYEIMQMREEGKPISTIAKMLTDKWGYKVTSNEVSKFINNVGEEVAMLQMSRMSKTDFVEAGYGLSEHLKEQREESMLACEVQVGHTYEKNGKTYEAVEYSAEDVGNMCDVCSLNSTCEHNLACFAAQRKDGKTVIFKLVEEVADQLPNNYGEPKTDMGCDCGSFTCECCANVVDPEEQIEDGKSE